MPSRQSSICKTTNKHTIILYTRQSSPLLDLSFLCVCLCHLVFRSSSGLDPARFDNLRFGVRAKRVQFAPAFSIPRTVDLLPRRRRDETRRDETRRERQIAHLPQLERSGEEEEVLEVESQAEEREQEHKGGGGGGGGGGGRIDGGMGREHEIHSSEDTVADDKSGAARWRSMDAEEEGGVHGADQVHGDEQSQRQRLVPHCAER